MAMMSEDKLIVAVAQITPVWFNREATIEKVCRSIGEAGKAGAQLVVFGEACIPGYPFWLEYSKVTEFNSAFHKQFYAEYMNQSVSIEDGHLEPVQTAVRVSKTKTYVGMIERPYDRGGKSVYASLVFIDEGGEIRSVHRKLMPTYDERLTWSIGDGHGLRTHKVGRFTVGGLNCWENWMPLARTALYAQGEDLHVAVWPGSKRNTIDITRFIAMESRSFVVSAACLMRKEDLPLTLAGVDTLAENAPEVLADGGSCIAGPDGEWLVEPYCRDEKLLVTEIDHRRVREERQNFDPIGHYSRPDVFSLNVDRRRQAAAQFRDE